MRLYPTSPQARRKLVLADLATVLSIAAFAWLGVTVHDGVADLASLGRGVSEAGTAVGATGSEAATALRGGLGSASEAITPVPLVGADIAQRLRRAGDSAAAQLEQRAGEASSRLITQGREGEREALSSARVLGWLTFLLPTCLLLAWVLPGRVREIRNRTAGERALAGAPSELLAQRAAFSLPYDALMRHTPDPFGDLEAGRHDRLVAALVDHSHMELATGSPLPASAGAGVRNSES